jgi:hypothetical protein
MNTTRDNTASVVLATRQNIRHTRNRATRAPKRTPSRPRFEPSSSGLACPSPKDRNAESPRRRAHSRKPCPVSASRRTATKTPGYSTTGKPEGLIKQITRGAQEIGDSIVNLIEQAGGTITFGDDEQPAAEAAAPAPAPAAPRIAEIRCGACQHHKPLLRLNIAKAPYLYANPETLLATLEEAAAALRAGCDAGHVVPQ